MVDSGGGEWGVVAKNNCMPRCVCECMNACSHIHFFFFFFLGNSPELSISILKTN